MQNDLGVERQLGEVKPIRLAVGELNLYIFQDFNTTGVDKTADQLGILSGSSFTYTDKTSRETFLEEGKSDIDPKGFAAGQHLKFQSRTMLEGGVENVINQSVIGFPKEPVAIKPVWVVRKRREALVFYHLNIYR